MDNKSIAKQLNVQILVLVLKSLQTSHHDLKSLSENLQESNVYQCSAPETITILLTGYTPI